jgi:hypothetical protein
MKLFMQKADSTHEQCCEAIPWVVNGRASEAQQQCVMAHVEICAACRGELQRHRELHSHMRGANEVIAAPNAAWLKLLAQIDAQPQIETVDSVRPAAVRQNSKRRWMIAALWIQGIAIAALLGAFLAAEVQPPAAYTTLATPQVPVHGAAIRVVFAPDAAVEQINQLLRRVGGEVVAGPSEAGVYTLAVPHVEEVPGTIAALRASAGVLFAEPGQAASESTR